jgi:hypothetical protein
MHRTEWEANIEGFTCGLTVPRTHPVKRQQRAARSADIVGMWACIAVCVLVPGVCLAARFFGFH